MAREGDAESQTSAHEQTPLLVDRPVEQDPEPESEPEEDPKDVREPKRLSWYVWRVFWTLLAVLVLVVFIKGWIDAGSDVNVSAIAEPAPGSPPAHLRPSSSI